MRTLAEERTANSYRVSALNPVISKLHLTNVGPGRLAVRKWNGMYKRIIVALDESKEAKRALASAIELAKALGSELRILTVSEPLPSYAAFIDSELPGAHQKLLEERNAFYADLQKGGVKQASAAGIKADAALVEGHEVQSIVDHINANGADLLVIGRRHHAAMSQIWGGTVHSIAEKVCCSILAVC